MTRKLIIPLVAAAALAGCNNSDQAIAGGPDQGNTAAPQNVTLPPSIAASKTYRCKNNELVYIDWMSDGTAQVKETKEVAAMPVAEGDLTGDPKSASVTYKGQSCKG